MRTRTEKPEWQQKIAKERIEILFGLAEKNLKKYPDRSKRYVQLARKIGLRYNVRFSQQLKRQFCKACSSLLMPGFTSTVRLDSKNKNIVIKCRKCNKIYRYPYKGKG